MNIKKLFFVLVVATISLTATAQQTVNMKFGKPTEEELQMTTYAPDSSAEAVVLCRLTTVEYIIQENGYLVNYNEKFRIKVLKPSGTRYAKVVIPYQVNMSHGSKLGGLRFSMFANDFKGAPSSEFGFDSGSMTSEAMGDYSDESVEDLEATAFNLQGNKVVKSKLKKSDVVKKKIDEQNYQLEFTVPDVKEGTVIEYEYQIHSELFWLLHDWYPQCEIPVAYAKLDMNIPSYLLFNIEEHGIQRLTCTCTNGVVRYKLISDPMANPVSAVSNHYICTGRNLKAMPKDDYVYCVQDFRAGVTAELKQFRLRGTMQMDYAKTWEQIDEMILNDEDLGKRLVDHSPLKDLLQEKKIEEIADKDARAVAVYQLVMSKVKWDGTYKMRPQNPNETLSNGIGSNADINLILIQSLNDVGLHAAPVVLRMRDQGQLPFNFPSLHKLSTFVVDIVTDTGKNVFLDASSKGGYLNVLPENLLVERARLVLTNKKSQWVNLQQATKSQKSTIINAVLTPDGVLKGTQTITYTGYAAMAFRQAKQMDGFSPSVTDSIEFTRQGVVDGERISICPFNTPPMVKNPFTEEQRLMPIEFPCVQSEQVVVNITLPDGYVLEQKPKALALTNTNKSISGRLFTDFDKNMVQVRYQFNVNKLIQPQPNYNSIRELFVLLAEHSKDMLVITRTPNSTGK